MGPLSLVEVAVHGSGDIGHNNGKAGSFAEKRCCVSVRALSVKLQGSLRLYPLAQFCLRIGWEEVNRKHCLFLRKSGENFTSMHPIKSSCQCKAWNQQFGNNEHFIDHLQVAQGRLQTTATFMYCLFGMGRFPCFVITSQGTRKTLICVCTYIYVHETT